MKETKIPELLLTTTYYFNTLKVLMMNEVNRSDTSHRSGGAIMRILKIFLSLIAILFINIILLAHILSSLSQWLEKAQFFSVKQIYDTPITNLKPYKLADYKTDRLVGRIAPNISYPDSAQVYFFSPFSKTSSQVSFEKHMLIPKSLMYSKLQTIDGLNNSKPVLPVFGVENKKVVIEFRDIIKSTIKKQILEDLSISLPKDTDKLDIGIVAIEDLDIDGEVEIVWRISGEFAGLPRGIVVHNPLTGRKKWEFLFGPSPLRIIVKDINSDGKKEIVFTAKSPHNNISYNGMNDDTSYIGVLDCEGKLLWRRTTGGFYTSIELQVKDIDMDGSLELITARHCHRETSPDPGQINIYDARSGDIKGTVNYPGISFETLFVNDMHGDSYPEIVASDATGGIRIWDHKLKILSEFRSDTDIRIIGVEKIPDNPFPVVFTWYSRNTLRVFDHQLNPIYNYKFPKEFATFGEPIVPVNDGQLTFFILSSYRTYMITPKSGIKLKDFLLLFRSGFSIYLLGFIIFNSFLYIDWRQKGRLKESYLKLLREGVDNNTEWAITVQEALHKMKSPLTAIFWETEKIGDLIENKRLSKIVTAKLKEISTAVLADIGELKLMNRFLMKIVQLRTSKLQKTDIKSIILELIESYKKSCGDKITFLHRFSAPLPLLLADIEQLKEAFGIIFDNAIDALGEGGTVSVNATFYKFLPGNDRKDIACVEIEDDGCGIPQDKLNRIFDSYYTTKKDGSGIGLTIARRIIESHGGWLEVESQEKVGTKIAIFFPVKKMS
jgi:signal transduction histidine kinase